MRYIADVSIFQSYSLPLSPVSGADTALQEVDVPEAGHVVSHNSPVPLEEPIANNRCCSECECTVFCKVITHNFLLSQYPQLIRDQDYAHNESGQEELQPPTPSGK